MSATTQPTPHPDTWRHRATVLVVTALLALTIAVSVLLAVNRSTASSEAGHGSEPGASDTGPPTPDSTLGDRPCWQPRIPC